MTPSDLPADRRALPHSDEPGTPTSVDDAPPHTAVADIGGDPVCWAPRVCPECGLFVPVEPPTVCPRCGAAVGVE